MFAQHLEAGQPLGHRRAPLLAGQPVPASPDQNHREQGGGASGTDSQSPADSGPQRSSTRCLSLSRPTMQPVSRLWVSSEMTLPSTTIRQVTSSASVDMALRVAMPSQS